MTLVNVTYFFPDGKAKVMLSYKLELPLPHSPRGKLYWLRLGGTFWPGLASSRAGLQADFGDPEEEDMVWVSGAFESISCIDSYMQNSFGKMSSSTNACLHDLCCPCFLWTKSGFRKRELFHRIICIRRDL